LAMSLFSHHFRDPDTLDAYPTRRSSDLPTRSAAGALLGQQLAGRGYIGCILLGVTPEGVEIAASAAKAMGAQFDVLVAAFIKLGDRKSTRLNSSHGSISYAVFCLNRNTR